MEKLEVGQVWLNGTQGRRIEGITLLGAEFADVRCRRLDGKGTGLMFAINFDKWIDHTGAKLEGRDG